LQKKQILQKDISIIPREELKMFFSICSRNQKILEMPLQIMESEGEDRVLAERLK
jgi:hypothetical protein